jgi:hypothetical protein
MKHAKIFFLIKGKQQDAIHSQMRERNVTTEKNATNNQDTSLTLHLRVYSETQLIYCIQGEMSS